jgi:malonate transporter
MGSAHEAAGRVRLQLDWSVARLASPPRSTTGILFGVDYRTAALEAGSMVIASTVFSVATLGGLIALLYPG